MYNLMGNSYIDTWISKGEDEMLDVAATADEQTGNISLAIVNKDPEKEKQIQIRMDRRNTDMRFHTVNGQDVNSCNTTSKTEVVIADTPIKPELENGFLCVDLKPHSVNVITMK